MHEHDVTPDIKRGDGPTNCYGFKATMKVYQKSVAANQPTSKKSPKTYNSGDSPVVTHLTTNPPVRCLNRAERTGSLVFNVLWSYVKEKQNII
jgi:hypothetical protein